MINAFPAAWLRDEERDALPQDRVQVLEPIDQAQDWESFLVSGGSRAFDAPAGRACNIPGPLGGGAGQGKWFAAVERQCLGRQCGCRRFVHRARLSPCRRGWRVPVHPALLHVGGSLVFVRDVS